MAGKQNSTKALANQHGDNFEAIIPGLSQTVAVGAASAQSTALDDNTTIVRLFATVDCFIAIGSNPTAASATGMFIPGGIIDFIGINKNDKIAVIRSSASGSLYLTEGA